MSGADPGVVHSHELANFWTSPYPYWNMKELAPELYAHMQESSLVIFKGDLKCVYCTAWKYRIYAADPVTVAF